MNTGSCLCKTITFSIKNPRHVINCHCEGCRKFHGNYAAYTKVSLSNITIKNQHSIRWYRVENDHAQRGFCKNCGSSLFWKSDNENTICISAGSLTTPTHLQTTTNIYTNQSSDFYTLDETLQKFLTTMKNKTPIH